MSSDARPASGVTRLSFIKTSAGTAVGAAAVGIPATVVLTGGAALTGGSSTKRTGPVEPTAAPESDAVMAYVRNAQRGEVTIVAGGGELTYRDPVLVKHLLDAAPGVSTQIGVSDVIAP